MTNGNCFVLTNFDPDSIVEYEIEAHRACIKVLEQGYNPMTVSIRNLPLDKSDIIQILHSAIDLISKCDTLYIPVEPVFESRIGNMLYTIATTCGIKNIITDDTCEDDKK